MIKRLLLNLLIRRIIAIEPVGMSEERQYEILKRVKEIEGFDELLRALISADVQAYFDIPEGEYKELYQNLKKGSVIRLKWLREEMKESNKRLRELKEKENENPKEPVE